MALTVPIQARKSATFGLSQALKVTFPVLCGYVPIGITWGLLFSQLGYHWGFATASSLFVFAGSAQFLSIGLLAVGAGLLEIFTTTLFLNLRHVFFGFSLFSDFKGPALKHWYLVFGLTDETYSLLTSTKTPRGVKRQHFCFLVTALNHSYWVIGSTIGALLGNQLNLNLKGIDFALTAMFVVLAIEQIRSVKKFFPVIVAIVSAVVALALYPSQMLIISLSFAFIIMMLVPRKLR